MAGNETFEDVGQVGVRVEVVELAGLDQGGDDGPVLAATVGTGEQGVLAVQRDRADGALDGVGVELDAAVVEEAGEPVPELEGVADRLGEAGLAGQPTELGLEPGTKVLDQRPRAGLALGVAGLWITAADLRLDGVEGGDPAQRLLGDRRVAGLGDLVELAPGMRPAERQGRAGQAPVGGIAVDLQDAL
jgi:hypothetical protein